MIDPVTGAALISAGGNIIGKAVGGSAMPAGPSRADFNGSFAFDNSGWTVATGQGKASATAIPWMAIAAAAVVVLILLRRK